MTEPREPQSLDFGLAALLLVGVYVFGELADTTRLGRIVAGVMAYAAAIAILRGIRASRTVTWWTIGVLAGGSVLRVVSATSDAEFLRVLASVVHLGVALAAPFLVLRFILRAGTVTVNVVFAGVTLYLLIGILFGIVYTDVAWTNPDAFSPPQAPGAGAGSALFYFSFIVLTTVGFGDIAAASDLTRSVFPIPPAPVSTVIPFCCRRPRSTRL